MARISRQKSSQELVKAYAYLRTSSATNVDGDSSIRQRAAIATHADRFGFEIVGEVYDAAVSGADPVETRPGFGRMLADLEAGMAKVVLVEDASRFARSLVAQELGLALLQRRGVEVITAGGDNLTNTSDPARVMMRQVSGAFAEFEKARLVQKLRGSRDRASAEAGRRVEGRKGHADRNPELLREVRRLGRQNPKTGMARTVREIAAELARLGYTTERGTAFNPGQVQRLRALAMTRT